MENEITFRTSVGGYRRDEVIEYVESMNEQIFCLKKESEEAAANYKARIHELETLLVQKEANEATLIEENGAKLEEYETENAKLKEDLEKLEEQYKAVHSDVARLEAEKRVLKEKLGTLYTDAAVTITNVDGSGWYEVDFEGQKGYIWKDYVN